MRPGLAKGLSESTVKGKLILLSGMLTDAVADGHIASNPLRTPRRARHRGGGRQVVFDLQPERKPPKYLEPVEARALLAATPASFRDMVLCALTTGFRRSELLGLQWEWIDFGTRTIDLRGQIFWRLTGEGNRREPTIRGCKYASERELPLWDGLAELLGPRRQATGWVFLNPETGGPWKVTRPSDVFLSAAYGAAGLRRPVRMWHQLRPGRMWHQLRHTYASVLAAGGVRRHEVEQLLGHKSQGTTGLYTHLFRDSYETVHDVLDAVYGGRARRRRTGCPLPRARRRACPRRAGSERCRRSRRSRHAVCWRSSCASRSTLSRSPWSRSESSITTKTASGGPNPRTSTAGTPPATPSTRSAPSPKKESRGPWSGTTSGSSTSYRHRRSDSSTAAGVPRLAMANLAAGRCA
ncbi:MAG: site-specific integrase [Thermoleophilaceae bacterium]